MKITKLSMDEDMSNILDKQLSYCGKNIIDVLWDSNWRTENHITSNNKSEWLRWGAEYLMENKGYDRKKAECEMAWIDLEWGIRSY